MKSFTGPVATLSVILRKVIILPNIQPKERLPVVNCSLNVLLFFLERRFVFRPHLIHKVFLLYSSVERYTLKLDIVTRLC